jgi:hypothetical protein
MMYRVTLQVTFFVLTLFAVGTSFAVEKEVVWALRDHYTFSGDHVKFLVDPKRAEWSVTSDYGADIIELAYTELEFADRTKIRLGMDHWVTDGRDDFEDPFGKGLRFRSEYKPMDGLHVEIHVNRYTDYAFLNMMIIVRNTSGKELHLTAIRTGVIDDGRVGLNSNTEVVSDSSVRRGSHMVPTGGAKKSFVEFHPADREGIFGLGLLQSGFMTSNLRLAQGENGWGGAVESIYNPPIKLAPGATAQSDAMWVVFSMEDSKVIHDYYGWVESVVVASTEPKIYPAGWATIPADANIQDLVDAEKRLRVKRLNRVLIPEEWYDSMDVAAVVKFGQRIGQGKVESGLTLDALRAVSTNRGGTIVGPDGTHWYDLRNREFRESAAQQLKRAYYNKFDFFVLARSEIPDSVLKEMNITRSVADLVAFELIEEAMGSTPVIPQSEVTIGNDPLEWEKIARATQVNGKYGILTGPVRFDLTGVTELHPQVMSAIRDYAGPVEFIGTSSQMVREQLNLVFALPEVE